ncbi:MAG: hypothetical protein ACFCVE_15340 [Phycisphaerae bacterium]
MTPRTSTRDVLKPAAFCLVLLGLLAPTLLPAARPIAQPTTKPAAAASQAPADAQEAGATPIRVTALSRGGKFIGTSLGGMRVVVREAATGRVLADGITHGSTGDTRRIMTGEAKQAGEPLSTPGSAAFETELQLVEPTRVILEVTGPLAQPQAATTVTSQWTLLPGHDYTNGDGLMVEIPGLVVDALSPPAHVKLTADTEDVDLTANVMMMCGCPIGNNPYWTPEEFEVSATVRKDGKVISTVPLRFTGETSQYAGTVTPDGPGAYVVSVAAFQPENGNTGVDLTSFIIEGE